MEAAPEMTTISLMNKHVCRGARNQRSPKHQDLPNDNNPNRIRNRSQANTATNNQRQVHAAPSYANGITILTRALAISSPTVDVKATRTTSTARTNVKAVVETYRIPAYCHRLKEHAKAMRPVGTMIVDRTPAMNSTTADAVVTRITSALKMNAEGIANVDNRNSNEQRRQQLIP